MKSLCVLALAFSIGPGFYVCAQTKSDSSGCTAKSDWITAVRKPDQGWNIDLIDNAHKIRQGRQTVGSDPAYQDVLETEYAIKNKYFAWTDVVVNPCDHSASLRTQHLRVDHAYGFSWRGKTFAYLFYGNCGALENGEWVSASCVTGIMVSDTTGTGRFDFLQFGKMGPSAIPEWVKNLR
jgi:hypothetical protein